MGYGLRASSCKVDHKGLFFFLMADNAHHEHLIKELSLMLEPIFTNSPQAIYLYLDDEHKICNKQFADMLGYDSVDEWVANPAPVDDVSEEDREKVIKAYGNASGKFAASALSVTVKTKTGKEIHTEVIMVPITYREEVFVLHFISEKKN